MSKLRAARQTDRQLGAGERGGRGRRKRELGAVVFEQVLMLALILLAGSALISTLSDSMTMQFLKVEIALAGGTSRTGGTDFCRENPTHLNCLSDDPLLADVPTRTGRSR